MTSTNCLRCGRELDVTCERLYCADCNTRMTCAYDCDKRVTSYADENYRLTKFAYCPDELAVLEPDDGLRFCSHECARYYAEMLLAPLRRKRKLRAALPTLRGVDSVSAYAQADMSAMLAATDVDAWIKGPRRSLWLHGGVGSGKTTLMALAAIALDVEAGSWHSANDMLLPKAAPPLAPLVFVDDVGAERHTPRTIARVFDWIDAAYRRGSMFAVTSNYLPSEYAERIAHVADENAGRRIVSRLREGGVRIEVPGADRRSPNG